MTEQQFDELINLYLDNEIGRSEVGELKLAIKENLVRRRKFERACQLHQAARKALTSPPPGDGRSHAANGNPSHSGSRNSASRRSGAASSLESGKNKQGQAHRNASVGALADRQERRGVAATVELDKVEPGSTSSRRSSRNSGARNFTFFDSPLGMFVAFLLVTVGSVGMYLILHVTTSSNDDDPGKSTVNSPLSRLDGGYDPKAEEELAAELKKRQTAKSDADVMRDRLYQSALTGQPVSNQTAVDYFSSHADMPSTGTAPDNANTAPPGATATPLGASSTSAPQP